MRVSERQVIGLVGRTCVGKTTVAKLLATAVGWEHRDCGAEIVERARRFGVAVEELSLEVHRGVDEETRTYATTRGIGIVIDGRYLEYVMAGMAGIPIVRLTCSDAVRILRYKKRTGFSNPSAGVMDSDSKDVQLCSRLYGVSPRRPDCTLDTTEATPHEVSERIRRKLNR